MAKRLTREELEIVLDRAITLQQERNRGEFTADDLRQIAEEIDVDEDIVTSVLDDHLREVAEYRRRPALPAPVDSKVQLETTSTRYRLVVPRPRIRFGTVFTFGLTCFALVILLTSITLENHLLLFFLAVFGVIFWRTLGHHLGTFELDLDRRSGELRVSKFSDRTYPLQTPSVRLRKEIEIVENNNSRSEKPVLHIEHGKDDLKLMRGFKEAEIDWVVEEYRRWLGR